VIAGVVATSSPLSHSPKDECRKAKDEQRTTDE